jgi:hypothetical protein
MDATGGIPGWRTTEMVMTDRIDPITRHASLTRQLRRKSRSRRYHLERMVEASSSRPRRNDILPRLELSYVAVADLRPSPRKVRKLDPLMCEKSPLRSAFLVFATPSLSAAKTKSSTARLAMRRPDS